MWIQYALMVAPWILLGAGIMYFIATRKNWKGELGELVKMVIERVKDGSLTWEEAYEIIQWIFKSEPSEQAVASTLHTIMLAKKKKGDK